MIEFAAVHPIWAAVLGTLAVTAGTALATWHATKYLAAVDDEVEL